MRHKETLYAGVGFGALGVASAMAVTKPAANGPRVAAATPWHIKSIPLAGPASTRRLPLNLSHAKRVSVLLKNVPISEALPRLSKKLGFTLLIDNQTNGMQMNQGQPAQVDLSKRVTMTARNVSVGKALDEFIAQTGLYPAPWSSDQANSLDVAYSSGSTHPTSVAGPFMAEAMRIQTRITTRFDDRRPRPAQRRRVQIGFYMIARPKVDIVRIGRARVVAATDAFGNRLMLRRSGRRAWTRSAVPIGCSWYSRAVVRYPKRGRTIALARGYCPIDVALKSVPWTIKDPTHIKHQWRAFGDTAIQAAYFAQRDKEHDNKLVLTFKCVGPKTGSGGAAGAWRRERLAAAMMAVQESAVARTSAGVAIQTVFARTIRGGVGSLTIW